MLGKLNGFGQLAKDLDRIVPSLLFGGPVNTAVQIVTDLQDKGPSWSGKFSNSWVIKTPSKTFTSPSPGQKGKPRRIQRPSVSGREILSSQFLKDSIIFEIYNNSPHNFSGVPYKAYALDEIEGRSYRNPLWGLEPQTQKGRKAVKGSNTANTGRKRPAKRGDIGGGDPNSMSSRTAPLDWFPTYIQGGEINRAIRIEMDKAVNESKRRTQGRLK